MSTLVLLGGALGAVGGYYFAKYKSHVKKDLVVDELPETDTMYVEDPVEVQVIMEFRKYFARIAHGLLSFHQTRNTKLLAKVGRELRDEHTWFSYYMEERSMDVHRVRALYLALEQLDYVRADDVDAAICEVTDLAKYLEDIIESHAIECGVSPMIEGGYIRHLMSE